MGRACNRICRPPSMCSPLATTETATMRRVFVGLARCSWASRRNYEITASSYLNLYLNLYCSLALTKAFFFWHMMTHT